ncbi:hypothetical protein EN956_22770, partial [Mesorhizobium sp. M7A.F.Ca.CA.004.05.2.1]
MIKHFQTKICLQCSNLLVCISISTERVPPPSRENTTMPAASVIPPVLAELAGKRAFVTGGGAGIGRAIAAALRAASGSRSPIATATP